MNKKTTKVAKRIYFAHPIFTYNKPIEAELLQKIQARFPDYEILNPKNIKSHDMIDFYRAINKCDILVFYGKTIGVLSELYYANRRRMPCKNAETMQPMTAEERELVFVYYRNSRFAKDDYKKMLRAEASPDEINTSK
ncbi:MAG: hypothetical protein M1477_05740 [Candidatus Thermoplasmatota archaeon]|nr:hypothetical protein [Candidatus Thermoplasmatota archaeon]